MRSRPPAQLPRSSQELRGLFLAMKGGQCHQIVREACGFSRMPEKKGAAWGGYLSLRGYKWLEPDDDSFDLLPSFTSLQLIEVPGSPKKEV